MNGTMEIVPLELYVSDNLEVISGVTERYYDLNSNSTVVVYSKYTNKSVTLPISTRIIKRNGYAIVNIDYPILTCCKYESVPLTKELQLLLLDADEEVIGEPYNINDIVGDGTYEYFDYDSENRKITIYYISDFVETTYEIDNIPQQCVSVELYEKISVVYNGERIFYDDEISGFSIDNTVYYYDGYEDSINVHVCAKYIEYNGNYYYIFKNTYINGVIVDNVFYSVKNGDFIEMPTKFWIENGSFTVNDKEYIVDLNLVENETYYDVPTIRDAETMEIVTEINGNLISLYDYDYNHWKNVTKFSIQSNVLNALNVTSVETGAYLPYIEYNGEVYNIEDNKVVVNGIEYPYYGNDNGENYVVIDNVSYLVKYTFSVGNNGGNLMVNLDNGLYDVNINDKIICDSFISSFLLFVDVDNNGNRYVRFGCEKFNVIERLCDTIEIHGEEFRVEYDNNEMTHFVVNISGSTVGFNLDENMIATYDHPIMVLSNDLVEYDYQSGSTYISGFVVTEVDGVIINGNKYPIITVEDVEYVEINEPIRYELSVDEVIGESTLLCSPIIDETLYSTPIENDEIAESICNDIALNYEICNFTVFNPVFGTNYKDVKLGIIPSRNTCKPISLYDIIDFTSGITISKLIDYYTIPLSLGNSVATNLSKEDLINNDFVNDKIEENVNMAVDMEKDVYYPAYYDGTQFKYISEIRFNLHFRTRDLNTWKIIEDDTEEVGVINEYELSGAKFGESSISATTLPKKSSITVGNNNDMSNWFVTDLPDYKEAIYYGKGIELQNASDLLGLMDFSEDDIIHQKMRLSKSFIRLSFYSTDNPQTQMLLSTSTIFMNEHKIFTKKMTYTNSNLKFKELNIEDSENYITSFTINGLSELVKDYLIFDDNTRLSSRIDVKNKYVTDTSSDGFYMYMFKDYSTMLHEATIFLRIDFYHAGIGKSFPFIMPMKYEDNNVPRPYFLSNADDVDEMKKGVSIQDVAKQLFIPINIKYDIENKKFVYYLPDNYRENMITNVDDSIMEFNLFELKIKNESHENDY